MGVLHRLHWVPLHALQSVSYIFLVFTEDPEKESENGVTCELFETTEETVQIEDGEDGERIHIGSLSSHIFLTVLLGEREVCYGEKGMELDRPSGGAP